MPGLPAVKKFPMRRDSVPLARRHVAALLEEWRLPGLVEVAALLTSELAGNAVRHARGLGDDFELALHRRGDAVVLEVADLYQWRMPELRDPDEGKESGRGLLIVEALAAKWGVQPRDPGKTAWVEIGLSTEPIADQGVNHSPA